MNKTEFLLKYGLEGGESILLRLLNESDGLDLIEGVEVLFLNKLLKDMEPIEILEYILNFNYWKERAPDTTSRILGIGLKKVFFSRHEAYEREELVKLFVKYYPRVQITNSLVKQFLLPFEEVLLEPQYVKIKDGVDVLSKRKWEKRLPYIRLIQTVVKAFKLKRKDLYRQERLNEEEVRMCLTQEGVDTDSYDVSPYHVQYTERYPSFLPPFKEILNWPLHR